MSPSMGQCRVGAEKDVPMHSHCAEDEQSSLKANDMFLIKTMWRNIMMKMLEMQKSRARSPVLVGKSNRERWARLLLRRHLLQWRTKNQRQNKTKRLRELREERVPPLTQTEEKKEGRNGGHFQQPQERSKWRCRPRRSRGKNQDRRSLSAVTERGIPASTKARAAMTKAKEEDKARSSSASVKNSGGDKNRSSRDPRSPK